MKRKTKKRSQNQFFSQRKTALLIILFVLTSFSLKWSTPVETELRGSAPEQVENVVIEPTGELIVSSNVAEAEFNVWEANKRKLAASMKGSDMVELPVGRYLVQCLDRYGYKAPESSMVEIKDGKKTVTHCEFESLNIAPLLNLKVNAEAGGYRIFNQEGEEVFKGKGSRIMNLPVGSYLVEFYDAPGFISPGVEPFFMIERVTTTIRAEYLPVE